MHNARNRLILLLTLLCFCDPGSGAAIPVHYTIPEDSRVSLAIYDSRGQQVRTLLSSELRFKGPQLAEWDGLDRDGKPAPAGTYQWKLISGQGPKAEYLLSLGTNVGINPWVAQHGGPHGVAVDADGIMVAATPEGSPLIAKVAFDGTYRWAIDSMEPNSAVDITADGGKLYVLMGSGRIHSFDTATGKRLPSSKPFMSRKTAKTVRDIHAENAEEVPVTVELPDGRFLVCVKWGKDNEPVQGFSVSFQGHTIEAKGVKAKEFREASGPESFRLAAPMAVKDGKLKIAVRAVSPAGFSLNALELMSPVDRIDARAGSFVALYRGAQAISWLDPETGATIDSIDLHLPAVDLALADANTVLFVTAHQIFRANRKGVEDKPLISDLESAERLAIDPSSGDVLVTEGGRSQQVKRFSSAGKLLAAYGRKGGRQSGLYQSADFRDLSDIIADGHGGFVITEANSAPRRTSQFDHEGKLVQEWYGGQQFYTFAAPQPEHPNLVWMDSQWGWMMQVEVDYQKRTWRPRACYPWASELDGWWISRNKFISHLYPFETDLKGDGHKKTYLWSDAHSGLILEVDETGGRLRPIAMLGNNNGNQENADEDPVEKLSPVWVEALETIKPGLSRTKERRQYSGFGWADTDGSCKLKASELRLLKREKGFSGGQSCSWLDTDRMAIYSRKGDGKMAFEARLPVGRTKTGAPIWDWTSPTEPGWKAPAGFNGSRTLRLSPSGEMYELANGGGDGYAAGLDTFHSHGSGWPGTLANRNAIVKYDPAGRVMWVVGNHAGHGNDFRGTTELPVHIAGFMKGCVGVCDYAIHPCQFWTEDGLYVGELLDSHVDDGLPAWVYAWWQASGHLAEFQYDLLVGGSLAQLPNGDVIFMGPGWNNVPVYKVHGLDQLARQQGELQIQAPASAAREAGRGLIGHSMDVVVKADPIADIPESELTGKVREIPKLDLPPVPKAPGAETKISDQIWFEAVKQHRWPGGVPNTMRWLGAVEARFSEPYSFGVYSQGGVRLWVGGRLLIDQWDVTNGKHFSPLMHLVAGNRYPIRLEWCNIDKKGEGKKGEAHLCWESPSQSIEHIPTECLYPDPPDLKLPVISIAAEKSIVRGDAAAPARFIVSRAGDTSGDLPIRYTLGGDAHLNEDFAPPAGVIVLKKGERQGVVEIAAQPGATKDPRLVQLMLDPSPEYWLEPVASAQADIRVASGLQWRRFDDTLYLNQKKGELKRSFDVDAAMSQWTLSGKIEFHVDGKSGRAELQVLDQTDHPIASLASYRGKPSPKVTSDAEANSSLIFNGSELLNSKQPGWSKVGNRSVDFELTATKETITLKLGGVIATRPLSQADTFHPTTLRLLTSDSMAKVRVTRAKFRGT